MISSLFGYVSRESGQMIRTHVHEDGIAGGAPRMRLAGLLGLLACGAVTSHESTRFAAEPVTSQSAMTRDYALTRDYIS